MDRGGSNGLVVIGRDLHLKVVGSNPSTIHWIESDEKCLIDVISILNPLDRYTSLRISLALKNSHPIDKSSNLRSFNDCSEQTLI